MPRLPVAMAAFAAALVLGVAPAQARPAEGVGARIINGSPVTDSAVWPSIAYLSVGCTGSLVAEQVVLTAAHCVFNSSNVLISPVGRTARVGVLDRRAEGAIGWSSIAAHPQYDPTSSASPYDVALITLASAPGKPAMPIVSPWQDALVADGVIAEVAGWGSTAPSISSPSYPDILQEAAVPIYGDPYCDSVNGGLFEAATMICAGDLANGIDTCFGDSGGPLALSVGGVKTLVGDTSWGPEPCANPIRPGVYGRISAFRPWLAEQLRPTPPAPTITAVTSTGPSLAVTWAEPGGTTAWSALSFEASDGLTSTTVEAPLLGASLSRATGGTLTITVTARNPAQSSSTAWSGVPTPTRAPVVSATLPAKPAAGAELTATAASDDPWGGAIAYQWLLDGADIPGASAAAYRPTAAQAGRLLSLRVAAANAAGTGTATVEAGRVLRAPQVRAGRVPVRGRAVVGGRLTAAAPSATGYPRPRVTYRFARNGRVVQTGRARVYRVRERDRGAVITGTVTWRSSAGAVVRKLTAVRIAR